MTTIQRFAVASGILIIAASGIYGGYGQLKKRDFRVICDAYASARAAAMSDDPATVAFAIASAIDGNTITQPARQAFIAISMADPSQKYALMKAAAAAVGLPDWECPAMREYHKSIGQALESAPGEATQ